MAGWDGLAWHERQLLVEGLIGEFAADDDDNDVAMMPFDLNVERAD